MCMCMPVTVHRDQRTCRRWYPAWVLGIDIRLPSPSASSSHPQTCTCYICGFGGWSCVSGSWYLLLVQSTWAHIPVPTPGVQPSPTQYQVILCPLPASLGTKTQVAYAYTDMMNKNNKFKINIDISSNTFIQKNTRILFSPKNLDQIICDLE